MGPSFAVWLDVEAGKLKINTEPNKRKISSHVRVDGACGGFVGEVSLLAIWLSLVSDVSIRSNIKTLIVSISDTMHNPMVRAASLPHFC